MFIEGIVEVKSFIIVRVIKAIKGVTVALKSLNGIEKAVAIIVEVVVYSTLIVF